MIRPWPDWKQSGLFLARNPQALRHGPGRRRIHRAQLAEPFQRQTPQPFGVARAPHRRRVISGKSGQLRQLQSLRRVAPRIEQLLGIVEISRRQRSPYRRERSLRRSRRRGNRRDRQRRD